MINKKDLKILWAKSAGRCAFPDCIQPLIIEDIENSKKIIGEIAHIIAKSNIGPRGVPNLNQTYLNSYENLILLCPNHHRLIDSLPEKYDSDVLREMKNSHEIKVRESLGDFNKEGIGWKVILQENGQILDLDIIEKALKPDFIEGEICRLHQKDRSISWIQAKEKLELDITDLFRNKSYIRFAIFSLAKISSAIHLGYLLSNRIRVRYAQYDRDHHVWEWPKGKVKKYLPLKISRQLDETNTEISEFIIKISLSAKIEIQHLSGLKIPTENTFEIFIEDPREDWLISEVQVIETGQKFREILRNLRKFAPNLKIIHLFYAGPTSCAIAIGQQINPSMNPPIQLYEFNANQTPNYSRSIVIGEYNER